MRAEDFVRRPHAKAEHRRRLRAALNGRSDGSVEFERQNSSAVLMGLDGAAIIDEQPAFNLQASLEQPVVRWPESHVERQERMPVQSPDHGLRDAARIWVGQPPPGTISRRRCARCWRRMAMGLVMILPLSHPSDENG
jgi:hypothetical protein